MIASAPRITGMRMGWLASILLVSGCAYRTASLPLAQPLEVTHIAVTGAGATPESVTSVRERTTRMLRRANRRAHGTPAPMSVAVELSKPVYYFDGVGAVGMIVMWPMLAGMITERDKLSVDVTIMTPNQLLHGHGDAQRVGSIYAPSQKRALAVALGQAIATAR